MNDLRPAGSHLADTRRAFDSVAAEYDGPSGNNALVQRMRRSMWGTLDAAFPAGARLLDLGCGTGIDAVHLASRRCSVVAVDWSPEMVARTRRRAADAGLDHLVRADVVGMQELGRLAGARFDGIYSNLGALNCAPDLSALALSCAALLVPGGRLVASVMGRICPWELLYYGMRGNRTRAGLRFSRSAVPVPLNGHVVWTRYWTPGELCRTFVPWFDRVGYRSLSLLQPPPYLIGLHRRFPRASAVAARLDDRVGRWPLLRDLGDHFLIELMRRG